MNESTRQLQELLDQSTSTVPRFPPQSRYATTPLGILAAADGRLIPFLRRRFVPPEDRFAVVREHAVEQGDRLDRLAATHLGDAELFWRLCDANGAMRPEELTETIGRRLRITLPEGMPGAADD